MMTTTQTQPHKKGYVEIHSYPYLDIPKEALSYKVFQQYATVQVSIGFVNSLAIPAERRQTYPDSKVHGANMGPIWGR